MKCKRCAETLEKDVAMERLNATEHQCPDCRHVAIEETPTQPVRPALSTPTKIGAEPVLPIVEKADSKV